MSDEIQEQFPIEENTVKDNVVLLGGKPVDFSVLNDYILNVSPFYVKTALRYSLTDAIEEMRRYSVKKEGMKFNWKFILIILLVVGALAFGLIMLMYGPQMMDAIKGFIPS